MMFAGTLFHRQFYNSADIAITWTNKLPMFLECICYYTTFPYTLVTSACKNMVNYYTICKYSIKSKQTRIIDFKSE